MFYSTIRYEELNINEDAILPLPSLLLPKLQYIVYSITTCTLSSLSSKSLPKTISTLKSPSDNNNNPLSKQHFTSSLASMKTIPKQHQQKQQQKKKKIFEVQPVLKSNNKIVNSPTSSYTSDTDSDEEIITIEKNKSLLKNKNNNITPKKRNTKPKSSSTTTTPINKNINEEKKRLSVQQQQSIKAEAKPKELKSILKESPVASFPVVPIPNLPSLVPIPHINENPKPLPITSITTSTNDTESDDESDNEIVLKEYDPEAEIDLYEDKNNNNDKNDKVYEDSYLFALFEQPIESKADNEESNENPTTNTNTEPSNTDTDKAVNQSDKSSSTSTDKNNKESTEISIKKKLDKIRKALSPFDLTPSYPSRLLPPSEVTLVENEVEDNPNPIEKKFEERIDVDEDGMPCKVMLILPSQLPLIIGDEKGNVINHIIGSSGAQIILPQSDEFVEENYKYIYLYNK